MSEKIRCAWCKDDSLYIAYHEAFDNFLIEQIANYSQEKISALLTNEKIVRNCLKI